MVLEFLFDPLILSGMASATVIILLLYIMMKRMKPGREVIYVRERDRRGQTLGITEESATAILCKSKKGGIDRRFFKWAGSYSFNEKGRHITRFFGKEGTAYTYRLQTGRESKNPIEENVEEIVREESVTTVPTQVQCEKCGEVFPWEVEIPVSASKVGTIGEELGSLENCLVTLWGKDFYGEIPEQNRKLIEGNKILVTVELESGLTPEGYSPVSEEDINEEQDRNAARIFGRALQPGARQELYKGFLWATLGMLLAFIAFNFGIFH